METFKTISEYSEDDQIIIGSLQQEEYFNAEDSTDEPCGIHTRYPLAVYENLANKVSVKTTFTQKNNSRRCFANSLKLYKLEII